MVGMRFNLKEEECEFIRCKGYISLYEYLEKYKNIKRSEFIKNIYILSHNDVKINCYENNLTVTEIINKCVVYLLEFDKENLMCSGFVKDMKGYGFRCVYPNTTNTLFKMRGWVDIIREMGDELTFYLFTRCSLIQNVGGKCVMLSGNVGSIFGGCRKGVVRVVDRGCMFYAHKRLIEINLDKLKIAIFGKKENFNKNEVYMVGKFEIFVRRMAKVSVKSIFGKYFKEENCLENKVKIMDCAVDCKKIQNFLFCLCKKVLGSVFDFYNFRILKGKLGILLKRNRFEIICKNDLISYFKINNLKIFEFRKCLRSEYLQRCRYFCGLMIFLFNNVFIPIVSQYFYCTETSFSKYKIFYFTKKTWDFFSKKYFLNNLSNFEKVNINCEEYSPARLIPKKDGFRLITNMSYSVAGKRSMNSKLRSIYDILKNDTIDSLKNSVIKKKQIYQKFSSYTKNIEKDNFILKIDIKSCYDNIPLKFLKKILNISFKSTKYCIRKYCTISKSDKEYKIRTHRICGKTRLPFLELIKNKTFKKNIIFYDNVFDEEFDKKKMINFILESMNKNIIKYRNKFYLQKQGLPQGCILSSLLCSLYYDWLDEKFINKVFEKGVLIRYIDDFLVITSDINEIINFLQVTQNMKEYGIEFNFGKIDSNFGIENLIKENFLEFEKIEKLRNINAINRNRNTNEQGKLEISEIKYSKENISNTFVSWCGYKINSNLSIIFDIDYDYFTYSLVYNFVKPGLSFKNKIYFYFNRHSSEIILNQNNIFLKKNIYDIFYNFYKKIKLFLQRADFINSRFLKNLRKTSIYIFYKILQRKNVNIEYNCFYQIALYAYKMARIYQNISK
ncbi:telomerase reverse transcriptase [Hamiltosporidium tvaerminnensis]|uniref:Telomerase reverse transcriptase n=1 Tax=Hamiltosporidium tvaerminnensis TaxID=1176355 RepID=A0A4Q9LWI8_9MICR|nr:telomerase reverse transcriptase [Hamiltosporidium tvaerminnensis]